MSLNNGNAGHLRVKLGFFSETYKNTQCDTFSEADSGYGVRSKANTRGPGSNFDRCNYSYLLVQITSSSEFSSRSL